MKACGVNIDSFILQLMFAWKINMNAVHYTLASVIIDSVIFISAIFVVGNYKILFVKGSDPLFKLLTSSYGLYAIYFIMSMSFSVCFFGIPAAMFD